MFFAFFANYLIKTLCKKAIKEAYIGEVRKPPIQCLFCLFIILLQLISISYHQMTPWCRDMYNWFTPDPTMGVWLETECIDCYRIHACKERLKTQRVFPIQTGLIPGYSGHVPGRPIVKFWPSH